MTDNIKIDDKDQKTSNELRGFMKAVPVVLIAVALFLVLCFITAETGAFGSFISGALKGLFSYMAYSIPLFIVLHALFFFSDVKRRKLIPRIIFSLVMLTTLAVIAHLIPNLTGEITFDAALFYENGKNNIHGGVIGGAVAFGICKAIGKAGLIIVILLTLVLYGIYFLTDGGSGMARFFLKILGKIVNFGAELEERAIEKKKKNDADKLAKEVEENHKKNADLYNDEFFVTDNGVSTLEIPEIGIKQSKTGFVGVGGLRNTVIHDDTVEVKSGSDTSTAKSKNDNADDIDTESKYRGDDIIYSSDNSSFGNDNNRRDGYTDGQERSSFNNSDCNTGASAKDFGIDDSADAIFTKDFDPYDIAMNERLAAKQSSRAPVKKPETRGEFSEFIADMTPEQVEKMKRLEAFEASRQAALRRREENDARRAAEEQAAKEQAAKDTAPISEESIDSISNGASTNTASATVKNEIPLAPDNTTLTTGGKSVEDRDEGKGASFFADTRRSAAVGSYKYVVKTVGEEPRRAYASNPIVTESSVQTFVQKETDTRSEGDTAANNGKDDSHAYEPDDKRELNDSSDNGGIVKTAKSANSVEYTFGTPDGDIDDSSNTDINITCDTNNIKDTPDSNVNGYTGTSSDLSNGDGEDDNELTERGEAIRISRSMLEASDEDEDNSTQGLDFLDDEEDDEDEYADDGELDGEEDATAPTEIPPEERNPKIDEYRKYYTVLDNDENDDDSNDENDDEEDNGEAMTDAENVNNDDTYNVDEIAEDEYSETDEICEAENDAPPFDIPSSTVNEKKPPARKAPDYSKYKFPPTELLRPGKEEDLSKINDEIQYGAEQLINTLESFNIRATVRGIERGPRITRYSIVPAKGVRVNQIEKLQDDIALAMAAESIRIEAPIPGKSAVGVEVPNKVPSLVSLRDLLESDEFVAAESKTFVCIGKSVEGTLIFDDIATMPHLLIAGATGMGKSVCINSLITSMLYKARPDEVKFIMIDPKQVEFAPYNGIPHLLVPVVTDPKQAAGALMWAVDEMNKRYDIIKELSVKTIDSYNVKVKEHPELGAPMPKIVIFIDELNDLMLQVRDPVEGLIMSIAQKARAAGIHLVIGTQRPSVNVITGVIKANIPSRIACKVSSGIDSRTILEQTGAERLIGKGDMLVAPGGKPNPKRVQGAFVSEAETESVVDFIKAQVDGESYDEQALEDMKRAAQKCDKSKDEDDGDEGDEESSVGFLHDRKFLNAVELAIRNGSVATSFLQRKLKIGYGKAAQYIDTMEDLGLVSEKNGSKPRDILVSMQEWQEKLARLTNT